MKVSHFGGTLECQTIDEFISVLNARYGDGVNEFWIFCDNQDTQSFSNSKMSGLDANPCLALLVNGDCANLTYFPEDGHPGFQSVGVGTDLDMDESSVFYANTPTEEIEVANSAVIPFAKSLQAAVEFFRTKAMPTCIKWDGLQGEKIVGKRFLE